MDLFTLTGIFLVGTAVIMPVTYIFSCVFHSILWGTLLSLVILVYGFIRFRRKFKKINLDRSSGLLLLFSLSFGTWVMFKTFHGGPEGELFVGSNNVFDFGHAVGLIRSMSWGSNVPLMSPFASGLPFLYNFLFHFWVAIFEYFGVPLVWAMNIPSILSFSALLIAVYCLPQVTGKKKPFVGWIAVLLIITNSSLTFWKLLPNFSAIWHLPTYPFAGPFDSSTISIFLTLNNFVNQRHLAFSIALGLFIYMGVLKRLDTKILGLLTGLLLPWNMVVYLLVVAISALQYLIMKQGRSLAIYLLHSVVIGGVWLVPYAGYLSAAPTLFRALRAGTAAVTTWTPIDYLWLNLGILPFIAAIGFLVTKSQVRRSLLPFVLVFIFLCIYAVAGRRGFEQKTISFFIIGIDVLASIGIGWLWKKAKLLSVITLFVLAISGFVDLMPIKNEFAFPLIGSDNIRVISWIKSSTPKSAVFVSYADIIDPVVFAGRTNYYGFFRNLGFYDRSPDVRKIYAGDVTLAKLKGISYVLVPKWQKNDFPYVVNEKILVDDLPTVYEDSRYIVFAVR